MAVNTSDTHRPVFPVACQQLATHIS